MKKALDDPKLGIKVIDVREPDEYEIAHIDGRAAAALEPAPKRFTELDPNQQYYLHCKVGARSLEGAGFLRDSRGSNTSRASKAASTHGRMKSIPTCQGIEIVTDDLQKRIQAALANPQNMGELAGADAVGTVGNADCGEMLRLWVKFKEQNGKKVIDRATFQSFGCETAIAVASLATELIRGKTAEEALALKTEELAGELGPLPPMKIHCAQLVEGALRSALEPQNVETKPAPASGAPTLLDSFSKPKEGVKLTFLDEDKR
jgi:nitrogen fixation protein NifU and related proteins